jgi:hypothetical protein
MLGGEDVVMKLIDVVDVDIYRDGGSYEATFTTDDGVGYGLFLEQSRMPDNEGLHHRWLFEYRGLVRPKGRPAERGAPITWRDFRSRRFSGCVAVVSGSAEEEALMRRLDEFLNLNASVSDLTSSKMGRLRELVYYIVRRERCSLADLHEAGFTQ